MTDEKDLEIARLQGEVAALSRPRRGATSGALKVISTLAVLVGAGVIAMVAIAGAQPDQTPAQREAAIQKEAERIVAKCEADYAGFPESTINDCKVRAAIAASERF